MAPSRRDQSKEKLWRYRLQQWRDSCLTVPRFCAREGINEHNFRSWQATIKKRDEEKFQKAMDRKRSAEPHQPASFVPVTLIEGIAETDAPSAQTVAKVKEPQFFSQQLALEILTPTGHIIRIFGNTDVGLLRVILASLGRAGC
jgi:hypothetical protein